MRQYRNRKSQVPEWWSFHNIDIHLERRDARGGGS